MKSKKIKNVFGDPTPFPLNCDSVGMLVQSKTMKKGRIWLGFINYKDCGDLCVYWTTTSKCVPIFSTMIEGGGILPIVFLFWMIFKRLSYINCNLKVLTEIFGVGHCTLSDKSL